MTIMVTIVMGDRNITNDMVSSSSIFRKFKSILILFDMLICLYDYFKYANIITYLFATVKLFTEFSSLPLCTEHVNLC